MFCNKNNLFMTMILTLSIGVLSATPEALNDRLKEHKITMIRNSYTKTISLYTSEQIAEITTSSYILIHQDSIPKEELTAIADLLHAQLQEKKAAKSKEKALTPHLVA